MAYTGSVDLISGIRPKNNGTFPLVDAKDVRITDTQRLSDWLSGGKISESMLPSYVDDVLEGYVDPQENPITTFYKKRTAVGSTYAYTDNYTPETGKIYVELVTGEAYRWSGSVYVKIATGDIHSIATGTVNGTIKVNKNGVETDIPVKGLKGLAYKDSLSKTDVGLGNVDNTSDLNKPISNATQNALDSIESRMDTNDLTQAKTALGNPIRIDDAVLAPLDKLTVKLEPKQDLHGYSKPWVGGAGKNIAHLNIDEIKAATGGTWNGNVRDTGRGVIYTVNTDESGNIVSITANGTATGLAYIIVPAPCPGNCILSGCPSGGSASTYWMSYVVNQAFVAQDIGSGATISKAQETGQIYIYVKSGATVNNIVFKPMLRLATSTADFEPYENICPISGWDGVNVTVENQDKSVSNTYPISLSAAGGSVYGGQLTLNRDGSGTVTVDRAIITQDGTVGSAWSITANYVKFNLASNTFVNNAGISSYLPLDVGDTNPWFTMVNNKEIRLYHLPGIDGTTVEAAQAYLAEHPLQVCYFLVTPQTFQLTAAQVKTLTGLNHISCDAGEMEIVYRADKYAEKTDFLATLPRLTASGNPITLTNGADGTPLKRLSIRIDPKQAGSGTPSPSNIRPISGWDGVNVWRHGKNLLPPVAHYYTGSAIKTEVNSDGSVSYSGTPSSNDYFYDRIDVTLPAGSYVLSGGDGTTVIRLGKLDGTLIGQATTSPLSFTLSEKETVVIQYRVQNKASTAISGKLYPMIRKSTDSDVFEAYAGESFPIPFPASIGTVYGANLVLEQDGSGTLTVDTIGIELDKQDAVSVEQYSGQSFYAVRYNGLLDKTNLGTIDKKSSSHFQFIPFAMSGNATKVGQIQGVNTVAKALILTTDISTLAGWANYLAEQRAAGTPVVVTLDLATPVTYHLTAPMVRTLLGYNNLISDAGTMEIEYHADPKMCIDGSSAIVITTKAIDYSNGGIMSSVDGLLPSKDYAPVFVMPDIDSVSSVDIEVHENSALGVYLSIEPTIKADHNPIVAFTIVFVKSGDKYKFNSTWNKYEPDTADMKHTFTFGADVSSKADKANPVFTGSISLGRKTGTQTGSESFAVGNTVEASGLNSHAEGWKTKASGQHAHAEGSSSVASGSSSHAEGGNTTASYSTSHAEGLGSTASGYASHAEGEFTIANHEAQHVFGRYNIPDSSTADPSGKGTYVEIVGNGTNTTESKRSNARTLDWNGNEVLAGKLTLGASPSDNMDAATKQYVDNKVAAIDLSVKANKANPVFTGSVSLGRTSNTTIGSNSIAVGNTVSATGINSQAFGDHNESTGEESITTGWSNHAKGKYSQAGGKGSYAIGDVSVALGDECYAIGNDSTAMGNVAIATKAHQHVFGTWNVFEGDSVPSTAVSEKGDYVEIIGNGTDASNRSNARTLDWNGNEKLAGGLTLGMGTADETTISASQLKRLLDWLEKEPSTPMTADEALALLAVDPIQSDKYYEVGDLVSKSEVAISDPDSSSNLASDLNISIFRCIVAHSAESGEDPDLTNDKWEYVESFGGYNIPDKYTTYGSAQEEEPGVIEEPSTNNGDPDEEVPGIEAGT